MIKGKLCRNIVLKNESFRRIKSNQIESLSYHVNNYFTWVSSIVISIYGMKKGKYWKNELICDDSPWLFAKSTGNHIESRHYKLHKLCFCWSQIKRICKQDRNRTNMNVWFDEIHHAENLVVRKLLFFFV